MLARLKPKSEFAKNVLTLMTGTTVAQAIPIAISPILTRMYKPEDFGLLALFLSITFIFSSFNTGRYELAIMLPKRDEDAINILALGLVINLTISLLLLFVIVIFQAQFVKILGNAKIAPWLYLVPITVFFVGLFNLLTYYNTRKKQYKDIAKATVLKSITLASIQLIIGFVKQGAMGLISGQIVSQFVANGKLLKNIITDKRLLQSISKDKIKHLAKKYIQFPKYSVPSSIVNTLSQDLINLLISTFFTISTLGFYSFAQKVLGMPFVLIGNSFSHVYFQQASDEYKSKGNAKESFNSTAKRLFIIGAPAFTLLYFIVEELFAFVFGEEWRVAGLYAKVVMPLFFMHFVVSSLSTTYDIFNGLKIELAWQITMLIGVMLIMYIYRDDNFLNFLHIFTIYSSLMYLISFFITYKLSQGNSNE